MAALNVRAFMGYDNWTRHKFTADAFLNDGTLQKGVPVAFASATDIILFFRSSEGETVVYAQNEHQESFAVDDEGNLQIRYGETPLSVGSEYEVRIVVFNEDSEDGFVIADYSEDKTTPTIRVTAA